jgi:hypothetical protein
MDSKPSLINPFNIVLRIHFTSKLGAIIVPFYSQRRQ